jgi:hypothetical protein
MFCCTHHIMSLYCTYHFRSGINSYVQVDQRYYLLNIIVDSLQVCNISSTIITLNELCTSAHLTTATTERQIAIAHRPTTATATAQKSNCRNGA